MDVELVKKLGKLSNKSAGQIEGVDQLIFDAFNYRCMINCVNSVPDSNFNKTSLFNLFGAGGTISIIVNIGKLVDTRKDVNSLRKLWDNYKKSVPIPERKIIDQEFQDKTILNPVLNFRHGVVAHNGITSIITWEEVDVVLKFLIRAWHLVSEQSGAPVIGPTYDFIAVSHGFNHIFTPQELTLMEQSWVEYSANFKVWMHEPIE